MCNGQLEKKRSKTASKQSSHQLQQSEELQNERSKKHNGQRQRHLSSQLDSELKVEAADERCLNKAKYKRQKGGLAYSAESDRQGHIEPEIVKDRTRERTREKELSMTNSAQLNSLEKQTRVSESRTSQKELSNKRKSSGMWRELLRDN